MDKVLNAREYFAAIKESRLLFRDGSFRADFEGLPLFLYTGNADKIEEFNHFFKGSGFYFLGLSDLEPEIKKAAKASEPPENAETLVENSLIKSGYGFKVSKMATLADDTGFFVDALNGEPGIYAGRYAGEPCDYEANRKLVLKKLEGIADNGRTAAFRCVITLWWPGRKKAFEFVGECRGKILREKRGGNQFGYDPIFVPEGYAEAFSQMPVELKNIMSHRGRAFQKLFDFLKSSVKFD